MGRPVLARRVRTWFFTARSDWPGAAAISLLVGLCKECTASIHKATLTPRDPSKGFEARLEETEVFRLVDHAQATRFFRLLVNRFDGFGHDVHVRLRVDAPRDG